MALRWTAPLLIPLALGCGRGADVAITWEDRPRAIATGRAPSLAVRGSGALALAYAAPSEGGGVEVFYRESHDEGDGFSAPVQVSRSSGKVRAHGEAAPLLRLGARAEILVAWDRAGDVHVGRSVDFGRSFEAGVRVNDDAGSSSQSFHTMEVAPGGAVHVAWLDGRDGVPAVYAARSADGGASFGGNVRVQPSACPCCRPALGFASDVRVLIAWRQTFPGDDRATVLAASGDSGTSWSEPLRAVGDRWVIRGCPHSGPALDVVDGAVDLVWYHGGDGRATLRHSRAPLPLAGVPQFEEVQGDALDAVHPSVGRAGGRRWLVFDGRAGGFGRPRTPFVAELRADGSHSEPTALPGLGGSASYPTLAGDGAGRVYAVWTERAEGRDRVVLLRGRVSGP